MRGGSRLEQLEESLAAMDMEEWKSDHLLTDSPGARRWTGGSPDTLTKSNLSKNFGYAERERKQNLLSQKQAVEQQRSISSVTYSELSPRHEVYDSSIDNARAQLDALIGREGGYTLSNGNRRPMARNAVSWRQHMDDQGPNSIELLCETQPSLHRGSPQSLCGNDAVYSPPRAQSPDAYAGVGVIMRPDLLQAMGVGEQGASYVSYHAPQQSFPSPSHRVAPSAPRQADIRAKQPSSESWSREKSSLPPTLVQSRSPDRHLNFAGPLSNVPIQALRQAVPIQFSPQREVEPIEYSPAAVENWHEEQQSSERLGMDSVPTRPSAESAHRRLDKLLAHYFSTAPVFTSLFIIPSQPRSQHRSPLQATREWVVWENWWESMERHVRQELRVELKLVFSSRCSSFFAASKDGLRAIFNAHGTGKGKELTMGQLQRLCPAATWTLISDARSYSLKYGGPPPPHPQEPIEWERFWAELELGLKEAVKGEIRSGVKRELQAKLNAWRYKFRLAFEQADEDGTGVAQATHFAASLVEAPELSPLLEFPSLSPVQERDDGVWTSSNATREQPLDNDKHGEWPHGDSRAIFAEDY